MWGVVRVFRRLKNFKNDGFGSIFFNPNSLITGKNTVISLLPPGKTPFMWYTKDATDHVTKNTMANIKSLKPFQPGYDPRRNTNGRPKGSHNISTTLKMMLKRQVASGEGFTTLEKKFVDTIINKAVKGDTKMIRLVWEMCDGKPRRQRRRPYYGPEE